MDLLLLRRRGTLFPEKLLDRFFRALCRLFPGDTEFSLERFLHLSRLLPEVLSDSRA